MLGDVAGGGARCRRQGRPGKSRAASATTRPPRVRAASTVVRERRVRAVGRRAAAGEHEPRGVVVAQHAEVRELGLGRRSALQTIDEMAPRAATSSTPRAISAKYGSTMSPTITPMIRLVRLTSARASSLGR